jgi:hypothetical protein
MLIPKEEHNGGQFNCPETYRLPKQGGDPYFGLSRSTYYALESQGRLQLIRLRSKGKKRGVTLVPSAQVKRIIAEAASEGVLS